MKTLFQLGKNFDFLWDCIKKIRPFKVEFIVKCSCFCVWFLFQLYFCLPYCHFENICISLLLALSQWTILGDPGAVSRAARKGATKVFTHRRKGPWVPTLTGPFPSGQANAGSWLGTKNALYYCAQSANSFSRVLFVSSYTTAIISPQLPGSFTKLS